MSETAVIDNHGNAKMPLLDAYQLRKSGWKLKEIGDKYGITEAAVCKRLNKYFPELSVKQFLTIREDLYDIWEMKNLEELVKKDLKKETTHQLNGNLLTINQIRAQQREKTGDININIINILSKALDHNDTQQVSQDNKKEIPLKYNEQEQVYTP